MDLSAAEGRGTMSRRTELLRLARALGWAAEQTNGGHLRLSKIGCPFVIVSATPSCQRWRRNVLAALRRAERAPDHVAEARSAATAMISGADPTAVSEVSP
jgi:hypothetical protein